jgi:hypothetical protein
MLSEAVRVPTDAGVKITLIVQVARGFRVLTQFVVSLNSALFGPVMLTALITSRPLPELVTVKTIGALALLTGWLGKISDVGTVKMPGVPPLPDRVTV